MDLKALVIELNELAADLDTAEIDCSRPAVVVGLAAEQIERLEAALRDARHNGLIYWEPNTTRGHVAKAEMLARIDTMLG